MQNLRQRFLPKGNSKEKMAKDIYHLIRDFYFLGPIRRRLSRLINRTGIFTDRYKLEDTGYTVLFTDKGDLFPDYPFRETISGPRMKVEVTLIATLKNEVQNVHHWMECIFHQSRLPDEIIIVDGGSTDGTIDLLKEFADKSSAPMHIICEKDINISRGRNQAIAKAKHAVIAVTDFGCRPEKDWLEKIIAPFERDSQILTVGGWYIAEDDRGNLIHRRAWPTLDQVNPDSFIPSSRSIAFKKEVWEKAHGYPEWLTLTGEDTYFALELRMCCVKRAFVPDAIVRWRAPESTISYWKKIYNWSVGDGESGLHSSIYWYAAKRIIIVGFTVVLLFIMLLLSLFTDSIILFTATLIIFLITITGILIYYRKTRILAQDFLAENGTMIAQVMGFLKGAFRRKTIDLKRFQQTKGIFFILAGVPIHDTGGGSRGAQIALEFLRKNFLVLYINKFDSYESVNLGLSFGHPNLLLFKFNEFSWKRFLEGYGDILKSKPCGVLLEFPLGDFLPLVNQLSEIGAVICYDLLDDWNTQLGSTWYTEEIEDRIISTSDTLIATAPVLVERLTQKSGRLVHLLPNAVNLHLFDPQRFYTRPVDLPKSKEIITYIGALWGKWFDWNLLAKISQHYPEAAIVVIGDYRGQSPEARPNLYFLGLKPQGSLPSYLAYTHVAIIPWKNNEITFATSPLKLYEYLAMHVPVVVNNLPSLNNIPYVYISHDEDEFIKNIRNAMDMPVNVTDVEEYLTIHSWEFRVNELIGLMRFDLSH